MATKSTKTKPQMTEAQAANMAAQLKKVGQTSEQILAHFEKLGYTGSVPDLREGPEAPQTPELDPHRKMLIEMILDTGVPLPDDMMEDARKHGLIKPSGPVAPDTPPPAATDTVNDFSDAAFDDGAGDGGGVDGEGQWVQGDDEDPAVYDSDDMTATAAVQSGFAGLSDGEEFNDRITLFNDKLTLRVPEGTPGAYSRKLSKGKNEGKLVWEKQFKQLQGMLVGGRVHDFDTYSSVVATVDAGGTLYDLMMTFGQAAATAFIKMLPNIDPSKPITVFAFKGDGERTALIVKQNGATVKWAFTKDNPNGMPAPVKRKAVKNGKPCEVWDWDAPEEFLRKLAEDYFARLSGTSA